MRIAYISDLHCEMCDDIVAIPESADVLVFAGDIHVRPKLLKDYLLRLRAQTQIPFIYVMGNHEYYGHTFPDIQENYREQVAKVSNAFLLEKNTIVIDGVRFLGTTLWSDLSNPIHAIDVKRGLSDFRKIRVRTPDVTLLNHLNYHKEFEACRDWLRQELRIPFDGPTIVVTHHSPSSITCSPYYRYSRIRFAFHSDLNDLVIDHGPKLWIYGHDHVTGKHELGQTKLVSNQPGYPMEHRSGAVFHIEEV